MTDYRMFFLVCMIILGILSFICLIRAIRGPKIADRIMAVNMIGTMTIAIIVLLAVYLNESMILDIALIYAVMSFVAVIVLAKIYIGLYRETKSHREEKRKGEKPREC